MSLFGKDGVEINYSDINLLHLFSFAVSLESSLQRSSNSLFVLACSVVKHFFVSALDLMCVYLCVFPGNEASSFASCLHVLAQALDAR